MTVSPYQLGATLYMPATRPDLIDLVLHNKLSDLRSLVICLEDAVAKTDVDKGLKNLLELLHKIDIAGGRKDSQPLIFVRPRNLLMGDYLNNLDLIKHINGFVIPKFNLANLEAWQMALAKESLLLMPTLETQDVFNPLAMLELKDALNSSIKSRVLALRIGGNDLMNCLGLRRSATHTLYSTPLGYLIPMVAGIMGSAGYALTAPVFERLDNLTLLCEELELDILQGLVGKTAIHPIQIASIHQALQVNLDDFNAAQLVLAEDAQAVFKYSGAMCEPATHLNWAKNILARASFYGTKKQNFNPLTASANINFAV